MKYIFTGCHSFINQIAITPAAFTWNEYDPKYFSFDVMKVLQILKENHYSGPAGLQCYASLAGPKNF